MASGAAVAVARPALAAPACADSQADGKTAVALSRACGRPVEDMSLRTGMSQTMANPDGTATVTKYVEPRFVRRTGNTWVDLDTTLRFAGGRVEPVATILPVSFSAGGTGELARLADGDRQLSMSWPAGLPVPTLAGDTATYAEVYPGVDLRVTAQSRGFAEVLVVKTRAALADPRLLRVQFPMSTRNVTIAPTAAGGAEARDAKGAVVFSSPTPTMWDAAGQNVRAEAKGVQRLTPRTATMGLEADSSRMAVTPDQSLLTDPSVQLPVYIDPSWSGGIPAPGWKVVASRSDVANSSTFALLNGASNGQVGSGRVCDSVSGGSCQSTQYVVRTFVTLDVSGGLGRRVLRSTVNITQKWSWTCNPASNATLWLTGGISSSTSWNSQPGWDGGHTTAALANHKNGATSGCVGAGNVAFDTTGMVQWASANWWASATFGFRAGNEGTVNEWKRFDINTISMSITYNSYPNVPDSMSTHGQAGCVAGSGRPLVAVATPVLAARVTDPDGAGEGDINGSLRGEFTWQRWDAPSGTWVGSGSGTGTPQAGGTTSPSPAPTFAAGIYRWQVRAANSWSIPGYTSGTDYSGYTAWCEFEADLTPPSLPRVVPDGANAPFVAGKSVRLTISPGGAPPDTDLTGYNWWIVDAGGTHATNFVAGPTATVDWTPVAGQAVIHIQAKDRIQTGPEATYAFNAAQTATEVARWRLDEAAGTTTIADRTGQGHTGTLVAGQLGQPGRIVNGTTALLVDDASTNVVDTTGPVVNTSLNFTISVWARLTAKTGVQTIAVQPGTTNSPFYLGYVGDAGRDRWEFSAATTDDNTATRPAAFTDTGNKPRVGVWTPLTAVYDATAGQLRLYVGNRWPITVSGVALWNSTGHFRIGQGISGNSFGGSLADLRVWNRALTAAEIQDLYDPTDAANVANDNVGQWLVEPETCFGTTCQDTSSYARDINLSGDVATTTQGQVGSGLQFGGVNGLAKATNPDTALDGPALYTGSSYTVSAWLKVNSMPTTNMTAISQFGTNVSGFNVGVRILNPARAAWCIYLKEEDTVADTGNWNCSSVTAAHVGTWVHLVAVFDAVSGLGNFYIDGLKKPDFASRAQPWDATGAFVIGATQTGAGVMAERWNGSVDTVYAYQGVVPESSINRIP